MKPVNIEVLPVTTYDITINGVVHKGFIKQSEWNGMVKFVNKGRETILAHQGDTSLATMLHNVFGQEGGEAQNMHAISLSSSLIPKNLTGEDSADTEA